MRIAQLLTASTGGIGRHVASLAPRLTARGHTVRVFCPSLTADIQQFQTRGISVAPLSRLADLRDADVVHAHGYKAAGLAALAGLAWPVPLVVTWHNAVLGDGRSAAAARAVQAAMARSADLTLGASSDLVAVARQLGAGRARLGPVAAPVLPPPRQSRDAVRESLGVRTGEALAVTVGRLAPQKNLGMLLDVAAAVRDRAEVSFVVVGDGPQQDELAERIRTDGSRVLLLGRRDDVADLLRAADVAVLTSRWEARALVAQEALLAGVPLLATRVGGIEELVGDAAVLVELDDVDAAARALIRLAGDPGWRADLAARGRARASTWPGEDEVADDVAAAYAEVLPVGRAGQLRRRRLRLLG